MRPEGASYTANLAASNTMFITTMHDRLGEAQYIDALTGEKRATSLWLRQVGNHNRWHDSSGQLSTQSNGYVAQLGGDLINWSTDGSERGHLGLMAGYGNNRSNTKSGQTGYRSQGSVDGYSLGVYGTWFANDADKPGLYVDSWVQYSWFNNHVKGEGQAAESYKSRGMTASLESGLTFKAGSFGGSKGSQTDWFVQPQAQAVWMGIKAEDHTERNGTRVTGNGEGNIMTRLGVRTYLKGYAKPDEGKARTFEPFIEANWIHNTRQYQTVMDGVSVRQSGNRNLGEIKTGVEAKLNKNLNAWGNIGVQMGDTGYSNATATLGIKYNF